MSVDPPIIIGIAGGSGSGKTTVADAVTRRLGRDHATLLSHDAYYCTPPAGFNPLTYNFDEPRALDNALLAENLRALRAGEATPIPDYDFSHHRRIPGSVVQPRRVLVLEGILVMADPDLRALMDHRVFVHTPEHVRLHRRLERDQRERGRDQVEILEQYFRTVRPMHFQHVEPCREHATLVLDGQGPIEELVRSVLELL